MSITPKQHRFVEEYLIDLNGTQAAIRAGYSKHTARFQASDLLTNPDIEAAINELKNERSVRTTINADWVLSRLAAEVDADLSDIYGDAGELLPIADWPIEWRRGLVNGVETEELKGDDGSTFGMMRKVKLSDRLKRIELIGRHIGVQAFKDQVDVSVTSDLADRVARAKARGRAADALAAASGATVAGEG